MQVKPKGRRTILEPKNTNDYDGQWRDSGRVLTPASLQVAAAENGEDGGPYGNDGEGSSWVGKRK